MLHDLDPLDDPSVDIASLAGEPARERELRSRGRETVARLLRAGRQVVDERGHDNARVDDIVERADVSHGTFYLYFSDRGDLLASLARVVGESLRHLADQLPTVADEAALAVWFERAELTFDPHVEVLRAAQSLGHDTVWQVLVAPLAASLRRAGTAEADLVAAMVMSHFERAIVRADIIDARALARVALGAAGAGHAHDRGTRTPVQA